MESYGFYGLVPPVLAIILAFITRDAIVALLTGILSGLLIMGDGNLFVALTSLADSMAKNLSDGWNIRIFLFCALLGGFVGLLSSTGAEHAFGAWAAKKLKSARSSQFATFIFGLCVFIDDYFNALATGSIMRPISDETRTSRAKLAYIVHSTAATVCIIIPVSSWVVTIMSISKGADGFNMLNLTPLEFFISLIPYNLYAFGVLFLVFCVLLTRRDFGPMAHSENIAKNSGILCDEKYYGPIPNNIHETKNTKAHPFDMFLPILFLICSALLLFPITTWMQAINGKEIADFNAAFASISIGDAFKQTDASVALLYAIIFTFFFTYIYYFVRGLLNISKASGAIQEGIKSMVPALCILALAWIMGAIIKSSPAEGGLGLGTFLAQIVINGEFPPFALAMVVFLLSAIISFATGTSWGTFGIMIPLVMPIVTALGASKGMDLAALQNATFISIAAVIGGAIFGDNTSPISDSTILSATGAGCPILEHVATQMPYAVLVAISAACGFLVAGISQNIIFGWAVLIGFILLGIIFLPKFWRSVR